MSKKIFIVDTFKTIISSLLIAFGLQFVTYPFIHSMVGDKSFGEILTIYTILTIASVVLGNTLNNIRLINVDYYSPAHYFPKFYKILFVSILIETIILFAILLYFLKLNILTILILLIINFLMCIRIYLNVFFRMKLEYNKILYVSIIQIIGMIAGLLIFILFHYWVLIFLISELFAVAYTVFSLKRLKSASTDKVNKPILKDYIMLLGTNGFNNINLYLDRLVLLPLIGGKAVTLAFLATFVGKMLTTFMYPVNNVLLSYISVNSNWNKMKQYINVNLYSLIALVVVMIISYPLTIFIVSWFYQTNPNDFKNLIIIGNLGVLVNAVSIMIQTLNTKHISITIQANFITFHTIVYILLAIIITNFLGLSGFFWTTLSMNLLKFLILNLLGFKGVKNKSSNVKEHNI